MLYNTRRPCCVTSENDAAAISVLDVVLDVFSVAARAFAFFLPQPVCLPACPRARVAKLSVSPIVYSCRTSIFYVTDALLRLHLALGLGCGVMCAPQALSAQLRHSASGFNPM